VALIPLSFPNSSQGARSLAFGDRGGQLQSFRQITPLKSALRIVILNLDASGRVTAHTSTTPRAGAQAEM
jgi:hypothetical protein